MVNINFKKSLFLAALALGMFSLWSCGDNSSTGCDVENLTYSNFGESFLNSTCATAGCHGANATIDVGRMDTYENAKSYIQANNVIGAINHSDGASNMPKGQEKMEQCKIDRLTAWINDGLPE